MSYTLITVDDIVAALGVLFRTLGEFKDSVIEGGFAALWEWVNSFIGGNIVAIIGVIGSLLMLWRLKGWIPSFIKSRLFER